MPVSFCHLAYATADMAESTARVLKSTGLATYDGGTNPDSGVTYRMIPLGDAYFEFLYLAEQKNPDVIGADINERLGPGGADAYTGWFLKTDTLEELEAIGKRLGLEPAFNAGKGRITPDGYRIEVWSLPALATRYMPAFNFGFLHWPNSPHYPGRAYSAPHEVQPTGLAWIELGGDAEHERMVRDLLGPEGASLDVRFGGGKPGVRASGIDTERGQVEIRAY